MTTVEVFALDENADESGAVRALREAKGLDEYEAIHPFGLLSWHQRPFQVDFADCDSADRFVERLRARGYRPRRLDEHADEA